MAIKEVYFNEYCPKCLYKDVYEKDDPCNECLNHGWNEDSHKPVKFEEKNSDSRQKQAP